MTLAWSAVLQLVEFSLLGLIAGVLAGLIGVGGGIVIVPILSFLYPMSGVEPEVAAKMSVATSLTAVFIISAHTSWHYLRQRMISLRAMQLFLAGGLSGAAVGSILGLCADSRFIFLSFGMLSAFVGVQLLRNPEEESLRLQPKAVREGGIAGIGPMRSVLIGFAAGSVSALFGIGGGLVAIPLQVFSGESILQAARNSSILIAASSFVGILAYTVGPLVSSRVPGVPSGGLIQFRDALFIGLWGIIGARLSVRAASRMSLRVVNRASGALYVAIGLGLAVRELIRALSRVSQ